jgi:cobalamin-dependent methionine synthase I
MTKFLNLIAADQIFLVFLMIDSSKWDIEAGLVVQGKKCGKFYFIKRKSLFITLN